MFGWIKTKNKKEKLLAQYCRLMRKAYNIAPKNKSRSDQLNQEAKKLLQKIRRLELNRLH